MKLLKLTHKLKFVTIFLVLAALENVTATNHPIITTMDQQQYSKNLATFAINIYGKISTLKPNENIVFSPFSIQTCVAMARIGAEGETAKQLDQGLLLTSDNVHTIGETFYNALKLYEHSDVLKIANKIYVKKGYTIQPTFNEILSKNFFSTAEVIDFDQKDAAADIVNNWVKEKTNDRIQDLVSADSFDRYTRLLLLNAIHFKGEWQQKFKKHETRNDNFYINESDTVLVPMMRTKARFRYAEIPELDATALEMPYNNSDLAMLIILPNSRTGLKNLEDKLKVTPLADVTKQLTSQQVIVQLPKFKAEFKVELNEPLKRLGMDRMFSSEAEFGKMLTAPEDLVVSKVIHKAFIDVNEEGTEAAAATVVKMVMKRSIQHFNKFTADHPFFYVLYDKISSVSSEHDSTSTVEQNNVLFMGTLLKPEETNVSHFHREL